MLQKQSNFVINKMLDELTTKLRRERMCDLKILHEFRELLVKMKANYYSDRAKSCAPLQNFPKSFYEGKTQAFEEACYMIEEQIMRYTDVEKEN